jgi:hypothetical protein
MLLRLFLHFFSYNLCIILYHVFENILIVDDLSFCYMRDESTGKEVK